MSFDKQNWNFNIGRKYNSLKVESCQLNVVCFSKKVPPPIQVASSVWEELEAQMNYSVLNKLAGGKL